MRFVLMALMTLSMSMPACAALGENSIRVQRLGGTVVHPIIEIPGVLSGKYVSPGDNSLLGEAAVILDQFRRFGNLSDQPNVAAMRRILAPLADRPFMVFPPGNQSPISGRMVFFQHETSARGFTGDVTTCLHQERSGDWVKRAAQFSPGNIRLGTKIKWKELGEFANRIKFAAYGELENPADALQALREYYDQQDKRGRNYGADWKTMYLRLQRRKEGTSEPGSTGAD